METFNERLDREQLEFELVHLAKLTEYREAFSALIEELRALGMEGLQNGELMGHDTFNSYARTVLGRLDDIEVD